MIDLNPDEYVEITEMVPASLPALKIPGSLHEVTFDHVRMNEMLRRETVVFFNAWHRGDLLES